MTGFCSIGYMEAPPSQGGATLKALRECCASLYFPHAKGQQSNFRVLSMIQPKVEVVSTRPHNVKDQEPMEDTVVVLVTPRGLINVGINPVRPRF